MKTTTLFLFSLFAASLPEFAQNTGSTTIPVAVLPTAANATLGRVYRWSEGTAPNTCPAAGGGGTGGSVIVFCVTLDNATWRPVVIGDTATANILTNPMNALGDMISGGTAGAPTQVPGNTSTTLKVLTQTGDGTHSAAPVWQLPPAPGTLTYYFTPTTNFGSYLSQTTSPYSPKTTLNYTSLATGTDTLQNWITPVGSPGLSFIPAGSFEFHIHALRTGGGTVKIYAEVWEADSSGGDIKKIGTTETSAALTTSEVEYRLFFSTIDVYNLANTSSRIVTRVIVTVSGSSPTVQLFVGGEADSHISLPTNTVDASNFVPYTGATKDVDIGAHAYKSNQSDGCATWSSNALGSTGTACGGGGGGFVPLGVSIVQSVGNTGVVVTYPANVTSGNLLVVTHHSESGTQTCSDTLGTVFSLTRAHNLLICYGLTSSSGADTVTIGSPGTDQQTTAMEFRLNGLSGALDGSNSASGPTTSLATSVSSGIIVAATGCDNSGKTGYPRLPLSQVTWLNGDDLLGTGAMVGGIAGTYIASFQIDTPCGNITTAAVSFK